MWWEFTLPEKPDAGNGPIKWTCKMLPLDRLWLWAQARNQTSSGRMGMSPRSDCYNYTFRAIVSVSNVCLVWLFLCTYPPLQWLVMAIFFQTTPPLHQTQQIDSSRCESGQKFQPFICFESNQNFISKLLHSTLLFLLWELCTIFAVVYCLLVALLCFGLAVCGCLLLLLLLHLCLFIETGWVRSLFFSWVTTDWFIPDEICASLDASLLGASFNWLLIGRTNLPLCWLTMNLLIENGS